MDYLSFRIRDSKGYGGIKQMLNKNKGDIDKMKLNQGMNLNKINNYINKISDNNTIEDNKKNLKEGFKLIIINNNEVEEHLEKLIAELDDLKADDNITDKNYKEDMDKLRENIKANKENHIELLKNLTDRFKEFIKSVSEVEGNKLDQDTIDLLNSPIKLTKEELQDLIDNKFNDNPTMIRVIKDYSDDKGIIVLADSIEDRLEKIDRLNKEGKEAISSIHSFTRFNILDESLEDLNNMIEAI